MGVTGGLKNCFRFRLTFWGKTKGLLSECCRPYSGNLKHSKTFQHLGNLSSIQHIVLWTSWTVGLPDSSVHGIFHDKNTGVSYHTLLLQGILPTQGLNPHLLRLLHWQADSLLVPPGKPIDLRTGQHYSGKGHCLFLGKLQREHDLLILKNY